MDYFNVITDILAEKFINDPTIKCSGAPGIIYSCIK